ncbi:hypothetical protein QBC41DRAFT_390621 [Cercophora samala]|uniref:NACHT domain-containing protein n=1 Tax=Cercophora samala TaxID=330535 RepID=A0AA40DDU3_9PEZI|nr:hypothetical protein QBC41DRAFT_390621 [Cercophora samala]
MEAIAAVALAGNVAQFVEYSIKAMLMTYELLHGTNGTLAEVRELKDVVDSVDQSLRRVRDSQEVSDAGAAVLPDKALGSLVASCLAISDEINGVISNLKLEDTSDSFFRNVRTRAKVMAMKPELKSLCGRLNGLRDQISAHLLFLIREQQKHLARDLRQFASSSEEFQRATEAKLGEVTDYLRSISEQTRPPQTSAQPSGRHGKKATKRDTRKDPDSRRVLWDGNPAESKLLLRPVLVGWIKDYVTDVSELLEHKRKTILDTLHFSQIREREFAVAEAHSNTFEWIFDGGRRTTFVRWLRQSDGVYWISGKAGSGKSTLMRFLTGHPSTRKFLRRWAGEKRLIVATHYFWSPGTAIQKSQEGLLRSLLLQILRQSPEIIPVVCADRWAAPYADAFNPWSRTQLIAAFDRLGSLETLGYRICLFVDGLDEYDGDHAELVKVIRRMGTSDSIKICASSRPWLDFSDAFEQSEWTLSLQDLTHDDIRRYIHDELETNSRFNQLQRRNKAAANKLGLEITERAHGVFLWVFLVDVYKERTARLFLTMSHAKTTFPVLSFYFMDFGEGTASAEFLQNWPDVDLDEVKVLETKKRQLIAQCKDLISITPDPGAGVLFSERVGFLHRTVFDYLATPDVKAKLLHMARGGGEDEFNADKVLLETNLGQLRSLMHLHSRTYILPHLRQWMLGVLHYAHRLEVMSGGVAETEALDELEVIITKAFAQWGFSDAMNCFFARPEIASFLELVCRCDLACYICEKQPGLTPARLDSLAPGWRGTFDIRHESNFEMYERAKITKENESDWRLGRQVEASLSSCLPNPTAAGRGHPVKDAELARVEICAMAPDKRGVSSRFGRMFRGRLFGGR